MALMSCMLETCMRASVTHGRALETHEPNRIGRLAKPFYILKACSPLKATGHMVAGALLSSEAGSRATRHVTAPEPSRAERQGLEQWDMWQH
jgi:hypothetical protein